MTAASVNGITIEYDVHGDDRDEPLLLIMGLGGQLISWPLEFVDRLVTVGFRVVRFDNRDIGLSTKIDAPPPTVRQVILGTVSKRFAASTYRIEDMADDAAGLLTHLGIEKAHIVGVSMGGMISQSLTIRHPAQVASLTSIMSNTGDRRNGRISAKVLRKGPKLLSRDPSKAFENSVNMVELISGPHYDRQAAEADVRLAASRNDDAAGTGRQTMAIAASPDRTKLLGAVTAPTLVIHGLVDPLVKPSGGMATARAVPGARLMMFPDMGHDLPKPRWDEIIEAIVDNSRRASTVPTSVA